MSAHRLRYAVAAALALSPPAAASRNAPPATTVLSAQRFGAFGDGKHDDGPAVTRMLATAVTVEGPVRLQFARQRTYYLQTGRERYAILLDGVSGVTLDGGGSLFLVDSRQRFLKVVRSRNVSIRNLKVDYVPLPFAEGTVVAKDTAAGTIDVSLGSGQSLPPFGGPTLEDGEQAYFGALWRRGPYGETGVGGPYWVRSNLDVLDVRPGPTPRVIRVQSHANDAAFDAIVPGEWRFSVPVRGVAHRYGPGESLCLSGNSDLTVENIEVWSAPWFAVGISANTGRVVVRQVNVRARPGTGRIMSAWRDAFHVKNNRASLLFEDCTVQGTGDDAWNIASHTSTVREVFSSSRIRVSQNFPLGVAAMETGDTLAFYSPTHGALAGRARIVRADPSGGSFQRAPLFTLDLDAPVSGLEPGKTLVWNEQSSNPDTVLRRCRMDTSCRFRSPITLDRCRFNALAWFTGDETEGPLPRNVTVRDSQFRLGQGNPSIVVALDGPQVDGRGPTEPVLRGIVFERNRIWGDFVLRDAEDVRLDGNNFAAADRAVAFSNLRRVRLRRNTHGSKALSAVADVSGDAAAHADQYTFEPPRAPG